MTKNLKRYALAWLAALAVSFPAAATTFGVDYTDQWWIPAESGWGVNFIQQNDTIFATLFVYGTDNTPRWYVATMKPSGSAFTGPLYQTTGPYFGAGSFSSANVVATPTGTMTVVFANPYSGALTYSVAGVNVSKAIVRDSFAEQNLAGNYLGGLTAQGTNCHNNVTNGPILIFDTLTVAQSGRQVSMAINFFAANTGASSVCTFAGTLTTQGRVAVISNGSWSCTTGNVGNFTMDMVDASQNGFNARFAGNDQYCTYNGYFGAVKDVL
jgi:hypothetical protein